MQSMWQSGSTTREMRKSVLLQSVIGFGVHTSENEASLSSSRMACNELLINLILENHYFYASDLREC